MKSVKLARRLVLEACQLEPDGSGGYVVDWQPLGFLWADIRARSGREDFVAGANVPRVKYRILVRGSPVGSPSRPNADQRFREGHRIFDIVTVADADPDGRFLEILAEEGVLP